MNRHELYRPLSQLVNAALGHAADRPPKGMSAMQMHEHRADLKREIVEVIERHREKLQQEEGWTHEQDGEARVD